MAIFLTDCLITSRHLPCTENTIHLVVAQLLLSGNVTYSTFAYPAIVTDRAENTIPRLLFTSHYLGTDIV
jgi:hypothetical protein